MLCRNGRKKEYEKKPVVSVPISIEDGVEFNLKSFVLPHCYNGDLKSVLIPKGLISDRIKCLAREIHRTVNDQPLVMLCVLKGSYRFFTELVDELLAARVTCTHLLEVDFIRTKSYINDERLEKLELIGLSSAKDLENKNVLVVEDIVDSGATISLLLNELVKMNVKQMWTAFLLSKRVRRVFEVQEDFVAFEVPDKFVVGFGLDYNQKFRDLGHICVMSEMGIERHKLPTESLVVTTDKKEELNA